MKLYQIFKLLEDTLPSSGGKAWIDAHGNLHNLRGEEHTKWLIDHPEISKIKPSEYDKDTNHLYEDFEEKGWIRLDLYTGILYATWNKSHVSNNVLKTFVNEVTNKHKNIAKVYIVKYI